MNIRRQEKYAIFMICFICVTFILNFMFIWFEIGIEISFEFEMIYRSFNSVNFILVTWYFVYRMVSDAKKICREEDLIPNAPFGRRFLIRGTIIMLSVSTTLLKLLSGIDLSFGLLENLIITVSLLVLSLILT